TIDLAVDKLPDGEVSPFLVDDVMPGDMLEVHGPLGGLFVWRPDAASASPVQLIGRRLVGSQHRHERNDAGSTADELNR
ncbi:hypothetical protein ACC691_41020, partial [Rhizobium johnstonii]